MVKLTVCVVIVTVLFSTGEARLRSEHKTLTIPYTVPCSDIHDKIACELRQKGEVDGACVWNGTRTLHNEPGCEPVNSTEDTDMANCTKYEKAGANACKAVKGCEWAAVGSEDAAASNTDGHARCIMNPGANPNTCTTNFEEYNCTAKPSCPGEDNEGGAAGKVNEDSCNGCYGTTKSGSTSCAAFGIADLNKACSTACEDKCGTWCGSRYVPCTFHCVPIASSDMKYKSP